MRVERPVDNVFGFNEWAANDRLMGNPPFGIMRCSDLEPVRDWLGCFVLAQLVLNEGSQL